LKILRPLQVRDFALMSAGTFISFIGDGVFFVAVPWQTYQLSDSPTALSMVGLAWVAPMTLFLLLGGVLSDRIGRRKMMVVGDAIRIVATGAIAALSLSGRIELWHMITLMALYGTGSSMFYPSFNAITPDIVEDDMLVEANALGQFVRPFAMQMIGPAIGGFAIAAWGVGAAFAFDAFSFSASIVAVTLMRSGKAAAEHQQSPFAEIAEGFRFVRHQTWLWATLLSATVALLVFHGPFEVLVPYIIKEKLGGSASDLGLVFAAGGAGAVLASIFMAQRGLPKRPITFMYLLWTVAVGAIAVYAFITEPWQGMVPFFVTELTAVAGLVVWSTLLQRRVPKHLLGRVMALDWFAATALMPVSLALTGPSAARFGVEATLVGAGILAAGFTLAFFLIPGLLDIEKEPVAGNDEPTEVEPELLTVA
jgi:DHA3 family tetracycline resistance protein-like MFS transporter